MQLKVQEAMAKIRALQGIHPQVGMLLLRLCCMPLLNYPAQVVPPSLAAEHFPTFDAQVADFVLLLLTLPGRARSLPCAEDRMRVFRCRLRLPMRHNGAGLISVDSISAAAFVGSVVAAAHRHCPPPSRWPHPLCSASPGPAAGPLRPARCRHLERAAQAAHAQPR